MASSVQSKQDAPVPFAPTLTIEPTDNPPAPKSALQKRIEKVENLLGSVPPDFKIKLIFGNINFSHAHLSTQLTLGDLQAIERTPLCKKIVQLLELDKPIASLDKAFPFFKRLNEVALEILDAVSLFELQSIKADAPLEASIAFLALAPDASIFKLSVYDLEKCYYRVPAVFGLRLASIRQNRPDLMRPLERVFFGRPVDQRKLAISALEVTLLSRNELDQMADLLPFVALNLLSDQQVATLDFSKLSSDQTFSALKGIQGSEPSLPKRLGELSQKQFDDILLKDAPQIDTSTVGELLLKRALKELTRETSQKRINSLFPPFAIENLKPGFEYSSEETKNGIRHRYQQNLGSGYTMSSLKDKEAQAIIKARKEVCLMSLKLIAPDKFELIRDRLSPEVIALRNNDECKE